MAQSIWTGTHGLPLVHTSPEFGARSRLNVHVEFAFFLIVPFYALWPDPRLLLIIQAILFVLGALPAYSLTLRRTNNRYAARCVALIYLLYPTAQTSVLFDFHGDTLAMPLLLFTLDALDQRAWRRYVLFALLALGCKFYVALPLMGVGLYVFLWGKQKKVGVFTFVGALLYGMCAFLIIRPAFAPVIRNIANEGSLSYISYYFGQFDQLRATLGDRLLSAIVVFAPALFVAWRGWRWLLPGLPVATAALLSTGPGGSYDFRYHHYATVVPFIIMALVEGVTRLQQPASGGTKRRRSWRGDLTLTALIVAICNVLLVTSPLNPLFWLNIPGGITDPSGYAVMPRDAVKDQFLREAVPPGVALASSDLLAPHLTNRDTLYLLRYPDETTSTTRLEHNLPKVDYALADALFDYYVPLPDGYAGGIAGYREAIGLLLRDPAFGLVNMRDGMLVFQRGAPANTVLTNTLALLPDTGTPAVAQFGPSIALVQQRITPIGPHRLRAQFTWRFAGDPQQAQRFVAVSELAGTTQARFVHLPSYTLLQAGQWKPGTLVQETFDVVVPAAVPPGSYTWRTGWYDIALPTSYATDARSLLPGSDAQSVAPVEVQ